MIPTEQNPLCDTPLSKPGEFYIGGRIEDHIILSVPMTTSKATALELGEKVKRELGKAVIVLTHNTQFLKVRQLCAAERESVLKQIAEGSCVSESKSDCSTADEASQVAEKEVGNGDAPAGNGCGSGVGRDGCSDCGTGCSGPADSSGGSPDGEH